MRRNLFINLILSFGLVALVAGVGTIFVNNGMSWMMALTKPSEWVPNILIPIVWTVIYISAAVIIYLWISREDILVGTIVLFIINGVLNVLWCLVFFQLQMKLLGMVVIILNLIAAILLWVNIFREKKVYAYILSIYPIWLCIATTLNLALWILN